MFQCPKRFRRNDIFKMKLPTLLTINSNPGIIFSRYLHLNYYLRAVDVVPLVARMRRESLVCN